MNVAIVRLGLVLALAVHSALPGSARAAEATPSSGGDWLQRETLTGDWGGGRSWLKERGITVKPRLTQFYQGLAAGDGEHGYEYGGKADLLVHADLAKLGLWSGLAMSVKADYNFGKNVNGRGGVVIPVNTALNAPGMEGPDAFDFSSVYFVQNFHLVGSQASAAFGKINMIDLVSAKPFMGGAGIDSFWNHTFTAPPTGTVPPYLIGVLGSVFTPQATYRLWLFDPNSAENKSLNGAFADGISIRGSVEIPVTLGGRPGHHSFTALYSTKDGTDFESLDGIFLPSPTPGTVAVKDSRYYFSWAFDQLLVPAASSGEEGLGVFGQLGISDGNPNGLRWSMLVGIGGRGVVPGRSRDNWGIGYYYDGFSQSLKDALAPAVTLRNEQGLEAFYNFSLAPWLDLGADLQVIRPGLGITTAVVPGLRLVIRM